MSRDLEKRTTEWALWFHQNKERIPSAHFEKRLAFYEKAIDGLLECLAIACEDIRTVEGRAQSAKLWLPSGVSMNGDMRKFG
jgi:hypothetical protein